MLQTLFAGARYCFLSAYMTASYSAGLNVDILINITWKLLCQTEPFAGISMIRKALLLLPLLCCFSNSIYSIFLRESSIQRPVSFSAPPRYVYEGKKPRSRHTNVTVSGRVYMNCGSEGKNAGKKMTEPSYEYRTWWLSDLMGNPYKEMGHAHSVQRWKKICVFFLRSGSANTVFTQAAPHVYTRLKLMTRPNNLLTWLEIHS